MTEKLPLGSSWYFVATSEYDYIFFFFLSSALDSTKFEANTLVNLPNINTEGMWEAYIDSASVDGVPLQGFSDQISTILDTGGFSTCSFL